MNYREITIPYCGRGWIAIDERDWLQRLVLTKGFYEPEVWESLFQFAGKNETVWDVGAHVGTFTIRSLFDTRVAEVHSFEPNPLVYSKLNRNVSLNAVGLGKSFLHEIALGSEPGGRDLYHGPLQNTGLSSLMTKPTGIATQVQCVSVDQLVFEGGVKAPTLMKIDVEGSEYDVLRGARQSFLKAPPKAIVIEVEVDPEGKWLDRRLAEYVDETSYSIRHIARPSGEMESRENYLLSRMS
jgi:FkbM family methyltransferase